MKLNTFLILVIFMVACLLHQSQSQQLSHDQVNLNNVTQVNETSTTVDNSTRLCPSKSKCHPFTGKSLGILIGICLGGSLGLVFIVYPLLLCKLYCYSYTTAA